MVIAIIWLIGWVATYVIIRGNDHKKGIWTVGDRAKFLLMFIVLWPVALVLAPIMWFEENYKVWKEKKAKW